MDWVQVSIFCEHDGLEALSAVLTDLGAVEQEIVDDIESIRDTLEKTRDYWDYVDEKDLLQNGDEGACIRVYVSEDEDGRAKFAQIESEIERLQAIPEEELGFRAAGIHIRRRIVAEEDWANAWREFYKPMPIGKRLLICPEWETPPEDPARVVVRLEPGLVFGTGEHQTTQLCMEQLEKRIQPGMRVLDLGCGSGILSAVALVLGASDVMAVDVDPNARGIVRSNIALNGIDEPRVAVEIGDVIQSEALQQRIEESGPYDVVVSNIVADVLIALAPQIGRYLTAGGLWISSGIIAERLADVESAVQAQGYMLCECGTKEDWRCLVAER